MSSQLSLVWSILLLVLACTYTVRCSASNSTENEIKVTLSGEGDRITIGLENVREADYDEYNEDENHDEDLSGYYVDDSIRVQAVIKPANGEVPATNVEKKKADKKKKEKNKRKKKTPCQTTHKNFCVHGKCRYLAGLQEVSCKCHENYFGERCTEQSLRTLIGSSDAVTTTAVLAVVAVLSTISIAAIIIVLVVHTRRKYSTYDYEAEERKKLGQEDV